jgi:hypothetical protein
MNAMITMTTECIPMNGLNYFILRADEAAGGCGRILTEF